MIKISILFVVFIVLSVDAFKSSEERDAEKYLSDFYDFEKSSDSFSDAIKDLQKFAGIEADGKLTDEVVSHMNKGRCGGKDKDKKKKKRYVKFGGKWDSGVSYNYYIHTDWMPPTMSDTEVRRAVRVGLEYWQRAAKIGFRESPSTPGCSFSVSFGGPGHLMYDTKDNFKTSVDGFPLDNVPGGVLAHCFFPRNGNMHYDNAEEWTEGKDDGINLRIVTAHEMGHGIGLAHSQDPAALMAPWYGGYISEAEYRLPQDDTKGAEDLYGAWGKRSLPKQKRELGKNQARLCGVKSFESVFTFSDNKIYVVAEDGKLFRLDGDKVDESFESVSLPEGLKGVDSMFYDDEHKRLVIFKGDKVLSASGSNIKDLTIAELTIAGKGMYKGTSSAAFGRYKASGKGTQYFWIVQGDELLSGMVSGNKVHFSRRSRPFEEVLKVGNNGKFPPSIDAAYAFGKNDQSKLFLFVGNSYYVGKPEGVKQSKYLIPAEYPKSFKVFLKC